MTSSPAAGLNSPLTTKSHEGKASEATFFLQLHSLHILCEVAQSFFPVMYNLSLRAGGS